MQYKQQTVLLLMFTANSNDAVIGIRIANKVTSAIKMDVFVSVGGSQQDSFVKI